MAVAAWLVVTHGTSLAWLPLPYALLCHPSRRQFARTHVVTALKVAHGRLTPRSFRTEQTFKPAVSTAVTAAASTYRQLCRLLCRLLCRQLCVDSCVGGLSLAVTALPCPVAAVPCRAVSYPVVPYRDVPCRALPIASLSCRAVRPRVATVPSGPRRGCGRAVVGG